MDVIMSERQRETVEWFDALTQYAKERKLPMRIMDELEECRKMAVSGGADWDSVSRSMEELLESIEEKTVPDVARKKAENGVSTEDIKAQIEKMARRCHAENLTSVDSMRERKNKIVKKMYGQLFEISHTQARLEELKNEELYLQFFTQCRNIYERDVFEIIRELLQSVSGNYAYMTNQMRNKFQSIGGYKSGIGNEKFYLAYEQRKDGIEKSVQAETETADIGGNDIISFGQRTKDVVKGIVKELVQKRKFLAWVPVLILLCLLTVGVAAGQGQNRQETEQTAVTDQNDDTGIKDAAVDAAVEWGKEAIKKPEIVKTVIGFFRSLFVSLGVFLVLVVLVFVLLYMCYLKILKSWCDRQIGKRCGEYLKTELSNFEQENSLSPKVDAVMQSAADEYERQYMEVLNQLFMGTGYGKQEQQQSEVSEWKALRERWNVLKYR